ncbi:SatD family protein [Nocardioides sp. B-3]|uniref:SatD family protein n=1 Tax=Nocardioides sp. B-3 TaxID=2895565 RepID=UPI00215200B0|nr:SatD family protein [Nocardioides sp. B-3]UUZ58643.1 SatD family protein [Nocardioides sp. B-3]
MRASSALDEVNAQFDPPTPMRMQVGDEYRGVFATLGDALAASLLVRLALHPEGDIRHGIGRGEVEVLGTSPRVEDGPGWWAARAAVERVRAERGAGGDADAAHGLRRRRAGLRSHRTSRQRESVAARRARHRPVGAVGVGAAWSAGRTDAA